MAYRKRRQTFNVLIENVPPHASERDVNNRFTSYGEIQSVYLRQAGMTKSATIKFLCEPDAERAVMEYNGRRWGSNVIKATRLDLLRQNNADGYRMPPLRPSFPPKDMNWNYYGQGGHMNQGQGLLNYPRMNYLPYSFNNPLISAMGMPNANSNVYGTKSVQGSLRKPDERVILCTYVQDSVTFYGHHEAKSAVIDNMTQGLQLLCPVFPRLRYPPEIGKMYAAMYGGDKQWYRCKVLKSKLAGKALVHYIDFGNSEEIEYFHMCELPDSFAGYPNFAPKCVLSHIVPKIAKGKRDSEGFIYLQEAILGHRVFITTTSPEDSPVYDVLACVCNSQDIINVLIDKNLVMLKSSSPNGVVPSPSSQTNRIIKSSSSNNTSAKSTGMASSSAAKNLSQEDVHAKKTSPDVSGKKPYYRNKNASTTGSKAKAGGDQPLDKKEVELLQERCQILENQLKDNEVVTAKGSIIQEMESVILHIQLINSIRSNPPPPEDSDILNAFSQLLRGDDEQMQMKKDLQTKIEEQLKAYRATVNDIAQCGAKVSDESAEKRNTAKAELHDNLEQYINIHKETSKDNIQEKRITILKETIGKLKAKLKSPADMRLTKTPLNANDLLLEYNTLMAEKKVMIENVNKTTDVAHAAFMESFGNLGKSFALYSTTGDNEKNSQVMQPCHSPTGIFSSESFKSSISNLKEALDAEVNAQYLQFDKKKSGNPTLIERLLSHLGELLQKIQADVDIFRKYSSLFDNMSDLESLQPKIIELSDVRQQIKVVKSKLRHTLADKKDLEEGGLDAGNTIEEINRKTVSLQRDLHSLFQQEDELMKTLSTACSANFPELEAEHPDLSLPKYNEYSGLLKQSWEIEHFTCKPLPGRLGICYESKFLDSPVIIKEFLLENEEKAKHLWKRIKAWNSISDRHLVQIQGVFQKGGRQIYVVLPKMETLSDKVEPYNNSEGCHVLISILESLEAVHEKNMAHGLLQPSTILLGLGTVALDFCYGNKLEPKGSMYQAPEVGKGRIASDASDMFSFGCLVLSVLFSKISFRTTSGELLKLPTLRSLVSHDLAPNESAMLINMLHPDPNIRPLAKAVLKTNFLRNKESAAVGPFEAASMAKTSPTQPDVGSSKTEDDDIPVTKSNATSELLSADEKIQNDNAKDTLNRLFALRETVKSEENDSSVSAVREENANVRPAVIALDWAQDVPETVTKNNELANGCNDAEIEEPYKQC